MVAAAGLLEHRWQAPRHKAALEAYREGVAAPPTLRWLDEEQSLEEDQVAEPLLYRQGFSFRGQGVCCCSPLFTWSSHV